MRLPFLPSFGKKENPSYYLVLILRNEKAKAVIFEELLGKIKVVGQHQENFKNAIENASEEEFLQVLDKTISSAEEPLPENIETQKTIFGVKEDWVEDNKIKKQYLLKLKKASDELGLTPIGFLVITEAIVNLLQKEEGAPVSAILVDLGQKFITVSLIRAGRLIESKSSEIQDSIAFTVDTVLKHFQIPEILPSRIILFNEGEDFSQEFISYQWSKSLPFLHLPQIVNLESGFDARAVLFGAAAQMGFEVFSEKIEKKDLEKLEKTEEKKETTPNNKEPKKIKEEMLQTENFGFLKDQDIAKTKVSQKQEVKAEGNKVIEEKISEIPEALEEKAEKQPFPLDAAIILKGAKDVGAKIFNILSKIPYKKIFSSVISHKGLFGKKTILVPLIVLLPIAVIFIFYLSTVRSTVVLEIKQKIIKNNQDILFSTIAKTNAAQNTIEAKLINVSEDGESSAETTGKKDVGTQAHGAVTIFNSAGSFILSSETILTSSNGLEFTLDKSVVLASSSGDIFSGTVPGKTNINITASQIGPTYNLPSNTKFSIGGNSSIAAKNDAPFSGGTKKEITVVAQKDIDNLLIQMPKTLRQKAKDGAQKTLSGNRVLLPTFINEGIVEKDLSSEVGDEANNVNLKATVSYQGLSYDKNDLAQLMESIVSKNISKDATIDYDNLKVKVEKLEKKNDQEFLISLVVDALLLPKLDSKNLASQIAGLSYEEAKNKLSRIPQLSNVSISSSLNIPLFPKTLSRISRNIKITINVHE